MKKELLISAKFDTSDFDKSVERMQSRLKDLYAPADLVRAQTMTASRLGQMGIGGMAGPGQDAYAREMQRSRRDLDAYIREQAQGQEKLTKIISKRSEKLETLKTQQKDLLKGSKEELEIKEKIARVEENNFRLKEQYKQRDAVLNQALDARKKVAPSDIPSLIDAFKGGGFRYGMSQIPGAFRQNPWGMGGALLGGIGSAMSAGADLYRDFKGMPIRTESALGGAIQGTLGRDVGNIYSRRTAFEQNFQPERQRAAQMAIENMRANMLADKFGLAGNLAMVAGGGMMAVKGAGVGAGIGSAIPGVGSAIGGAAGMIPGAMVAGKGLMGMMGDERQRSLMLSPFSKTSSARYQSMIAEQVAKDFESTIEAQKRQNPFKTAAIAEYEQNYMRNLQAQRSMGLTNQGFYGAGGFLQQNIQAGFTPEMGLEMAGGILGAGGSTRMARESVFGNQLARGMNLTNAGQVLGTISGGMGGAEASRQATIKILAEGMRLGLDDSKFAEENRRFTMAAAEVIARSGATTGEDAGRTAARFSSFMAESTGRGIEAGASAYERYQQITSTTTGPRGVMRAAGFLSDPKLSQLDTVAKQSLMGMREDEINENNLQAVAIADKLGISVDDLRDRIAGVNKASVSRFKQHDQARDRLKAKGIDIRNIRTSKDFAALDAQSKADIYTMSTLEGAENQMTPREARGFMAGQLGQGTPEDIQRDREAVLRGRIAGKDTGRMEDTTVAAMAADSAAVLKNFNDMKGGMDAAAKSAAAFTIEIRELNAQLQQALEDSRTGKGSKSAIVELIQKIMTTPNASTQTQAGKKSQ